MWGLTSKKCSKVPSRKGKDVIFTLTDYKPDRKRDQYLIDVLRKEYEDILKNKGFVSYALTFVIGLYFFTGITNINFYTILFNPIFVLTYYAVTEQKRK